MEEFSCEIKEEMFDINKKRVIESFHNIDLFWKAGWFINGGKLVSELY